MTLTATLILALGMSMDAFAASIGKGAVLHRPRFAEALRTGLVFGTVEAATPIAGWALGLSASHYVAAWDHWIAFALLGVLGLRMVHEGFSRPRLAERRNGRHSLAVLLATAFATSLDAMAVGVGLALLGADILHTAAAIGVATLVMATAGVMVGRWFGPLVGRGADVFGGLLLIAIGTGILVEHLGA